MEHIWKRINGTIQHSEGKPICIACGYTYDPEKNRNGWAREFSEFLGRPFYWHSMRHYFTTMLARDEVPESVIQDIIAWESADMVKLYTDISKDENIGRYFNKQKFRIIKGA